MIKLEFQIDNNTKSIIINKTTNTIYFINENDKVIRVETLNTNDRSAILAEINNMKLGDFNYNSPKFLGNDDLVYIQWKAAAKNISEKKQKIFLQRLLKSGKEIVIEQRIFKLSELERLKFELDFIILSDKIYEYINDGYTYKVIDIIYKERLCQVLFNKLGKFYRIELNGKFLAF